MEPWWWWWCVFARGRCCHGWASSRQALGWALAIDANCYLPHNHPGDEHYFLQMGTRSSTEAT